MHPRTLADLKLEISETSHQPFLSGQANHVPNRPVDSNREASPPRSVASENSLEDPGISRKGLSINI